MKKQRNIFQTKGQGKIPETDLNKIKISDLPDKELKIMIIKVLTKDKRTMHEQSEHFSKKVKKKKKKTLNFNP